VQYFCYSGHWWPGPAGKYFNYIDTSTTGSGTVAEDVRLSASPADDDTASDNDELWVLDHD
jgi:hypothetical protein